jgi:tetratricopeptide (TPR) repeat protein
LLSRLLTILALLILAASAFAAETPDANEEFAMANQFYEDRDFENAIRLYEGIIAQGGESAPLYFNLGNAYFKSGDLGHAIWNYMYARRLAPADEDIRANLEFAQQFTSVGMEGVQLNPVKTFMRSLVAEHTVTTLAWISTAFLFVVMVLMSLRYAFRKRSPALRGLLIGMLIMMHAAMALTSFKYRDDYLTERAVIIAEEAPVYTGPSENSDVELQGAPGLVIEILDEQDGFLQVLFENKRRGWIKPDLVAKI